jgi:hypothetical protein
MTAAEISSPEPHGTGPIGSSSFDLEVEEGRRRYLVVTLDTRTGEKSFAGPFRTAIAALCTADVEYQVDRDQGGQGELTFHVAPLLPPLGCDHTPRQPAT